MAIEPTFLPNLNELGVTFNCFGVLEESNELLVVYSNNKVAAFDLTTKTPTGWTKRNFDSLPASYLKRHNPIIGFC